MKRFASTELLFGGGHLSLKVGDGGCTTMATEARSCSALLRALSHQIPPYRDSNPEKQPSVRRASFSKTFEETSRERHQIYLRTLHFEVHNCNHEIVIKGHDRHERHLWNVWHSVGWPASSGTSEGEGRVQE